MRSQDSILAFSSRIGSKRRLDSNKELIFIVVKSGYLRFCRHGPVFILQHPGFPRSNWGVGGWEAPNYYLRTERRDMSLASIVNTPMGFWVISMKYFGKKSCSLLLRTVLDVSVSCKLVVRFSFHAAFWEKIALLCFGLD